MKKLILLSVVLVLAVTSCADVTNIDNCILLEPYGFWHGVWHGWVSGFALIGSLFNDDIAVYAVNNSGGWYDFGFLLGIGSIGGSVGRSFK